MISNEKYRRSDKLSSEWIWERLEILPGAVIPCQRSLHAASLYENKMIIFGGYDGHVRVNDFYEFNLQTLKWSEIQSRGVPPSPRDRHSAVTHKTSFYVFGGFDGSSRVCDLHEYNFETQEWRQIHPTNGTPPSARHSHASVTYKNILYVFGGYDGAYKNDLQQFDFDTNTWQLVQTNGSPPRARYRATCVVNLEKQKMFLFGGHDGTRHLNDTHVFNFETNTWMILDTDGQIPYSRDSHVAVYYNNSMYVFGGSSGSPLDDFHELRLDDSGYSGRWNPVLLGTVPDDAVTSPSGAQTKVVPMKSTPGLRFCHSAVIYDNCMYIFGGYDGANRLNDLTRFRFGKGHILRPHEIPKSTLVSDLKEYVGSSLLSDVTFIVEGIPVHAHKILCIRCPYFRAMLTGEMMESRANEIVINDIRHPIFVLLLEYIYTDIVEVNLDVAMELFKASDQFGIDRLRRICEEAMLSGISVENAATLFLGADLHDAKELRQRCLQFILAHFNEVSRTHAFEEMGRTNIDLVFEILKIR